MASLISSLLIKHLPKGMYLKALNKIQEIIVNINF